MNWGSCDYRQLQKIRDNLDRLERMDMNKFCQDVSKELAARLLASDAGGTLPEVQRQEGRDPTPGLDGPDRRRGRCQQLDGRKGLRSGATCLSAGQELLCTGHQPCGVCQLC